MNHKPVWKIWIKRGLALLLGTILLWLVVLMVQIHAYASVRDNGPADAAIVLGAAVWQGEPSPVFAARIDHAIDLYRTGRVQALIFTGGVGIGDNVAEADAGKAYAIEHGVPTEAIFTETHSRTTYENYRNAEGIIQREGFERILVVSDPLHMKRAIMMAEDVGLDAYPSSTPTTRYITWQSKSRLLLREAYLYAKYTLRKLFR